MHLRSDSLAPWAHIDPRLAFCRYDADSHATFSDNQSPHLAWSGVPEGTRSFALICCDADVPSEGSQVNQEGMTVPVDLPRVDFFHWVLVDLSPAPASIAEGEFSDGVTPHGKPGPEAPRGARQGINDYTGWFASDPDMKGEYFGYDGPCPPWNDAIEHHYVFTLYALDVERLPVEGSFAGRDVLGALDGHVLAQARITGRYHLNPALD